MQSSKGDRQHPFINWIGHPGTIITMVTLLIGLTAYIVRLENKIDQLAIQNARFEQRIIDLTVALKNSELEINRMKIGNAQVIERWISIDRRLQSIEKNTAPMTTPQTSGYPRH